MGVYDPLPEIESAYSGGWAPPNTGSGKERADTFSGAGGSTQARVRSFGWTYAPVPDVLTPVGNRNTGYVTSTVPGGQWQRGDLPDEMPDQTGFALGYPRVMREPGTNWGTYPSIKRG